ncbi:hypothetical protein M0804_013288 [Polistes exclamans]|nr:hypothetical protein M0804_013288 [Polistes exclamans]
MSNEDSLRKVNPITYYLNKALSMINIYKPHQEEIFYEWLNKFEYVADIVGVPYDGMTEFFEEMVDNDFHKTVRQSFFSVNFLKLEYKQIIDNYLLYFANSYENDLNRKRLFCRRQYKKETTKKYANSLRRISNSCYCSEGLETELCEQFIIGIRDDEIRNHLIEIPGLSFDETVKRAIEFEENNHINTYLNEALTMINTYNIEREGTFHLWFNKFEYVADFVGVPNKTMVKFFKVMIDDEIHNKVKKTYPFVDFSLYSYEEILNYYIRCFDSAYEISFHRKRFYNRNQYEKEPIAKYADSLRNILNKCFYTNNTEDIFWKQFIIGIRNDDVRIHLNKTPHLTYAKTIRKAIEFEEMNEMTHYLNQALTITNMYNPKKEDIFYEWLNKFEYVVEFVGVPNDKMIKFFNSMIENDVRTGVMQTFPCVNFSELSYEEIINYYHHFFSPSYNSDLNTIRFMYRNQYKQETIEKYADCLKKIYDKCVDSNRQKEILCGKFLHGIRDAVVRKQLCKTTCMSFDNLVKIAIQLENHNLITNYLNPALLMINIYNPEKEGMFYVWLNKFEFVADFVKVPDHLMVRFFNKMVDEDIHLTVKGVYTCVNFSVFTYDEIINHYLRFFVLSNVTDLHQSRLICRNQYEQETIMKYAENLRKIYDKCSDENRREEIICEQFIKGIRNNDIKTELNKITGKTFDEIVQFAVELDNRNFITNYINPALSIVHIYNPKREGMFYSWLNKFEYVADIINVPNDKMVEFFTKMIDNDIHMAVKSIHPCVNFSELSYDEIINLYLNLFSLSNLNDLHERRLVCRIRYEQETIEKYAESLRKIYNKCSYTNLSEKIICEQFIKGIRNDDIKTELMKTPDISFDEMVTFAIQFENSNFINKYINPALTMIHKYDPSNGGIFYNWFNKFEYVADTLGVPDNQMIEFFTKMIDNDLHTLVKNTYPSINFTILSYEETIKQYLRFFNAFHTDDLHVKRLMFRGQYEQETIEKYANNLQKIYNMCISTNRQEINLRNLFIKGINNDEIRTLLNTLPVVPFDETVRKAIVFKKQLNLSQK